MQKQPGPGAPRARTAEPHREAPRPEREPHPRAPSATTRLALRARPVQQLRAGRSAEGAGAVAGPADSRAPVQARLEVGPAGGSHEQEADAVARQAVDSIHAAATGDGPPSGTPGSLPAGPGPGSPIRRAPDAPRPPRATAADGLAVNRPMEAAIDRARGGGHALPETVRGSMEQALGADLRGVRVHTGSEADGLTRSLGARAFTTGSDVFFRRGEYHPTSRPGQELLAHELVHVIQQGGAARGFVQRKVGFEFETGVQVHTATAKQPVAGYTAPVFTAKDDSWLIKTDNSKLEFILDPPLPTTEEGEKKLHRIMGEMVSFAEAMVAVTSTVEPKKSGLVKNVAPDLGTAHQAGQPKDDLVIWADKLTLDDVKASPQATGGVTLEQVPTLMKAALGLKFKHLENNPRFTPSFNLDPQPPDVSHLDPEKPEDKEQIDILMEGYEFEKQFAEQLAESYAGFKSVDPKALPYTSMGMNVQDPQAMARALQIVEEAWKELPRMWVEEKKQQTGKQDVVAPEHGFKKLKGLMMLVISYLYVGDELTQPPPYSKVIALMMARTNFTALYALLADEEKELFTPANVLGIAQLGEGPVFKKGFGPKGHVIQGPKRVEWLWSIAKGTPVNLTKAGTEDAPPEAQRFLPTDLMSLGSGSGVAEGSHGASSSMGAQAEPDVSRKTGKKELAVLELRRLPKGQHPKDWDATATMLFKLFRALEDK